MSEGVWFEGSVPEAISTCMEQRSLLVVHVTDQAAVADPSWADQSVIDSVRTSPVLALHLSMVCRRMIGRVGWLTGRMQGTQEALQFMSIFPVLVFPTTYFINVARSPSAESTKPFIHCVVQFSTDTCTDRDWCIGR